MGIALELSKVAADPLSNPLRVTSATGNLSSTGSSLMLWAYANDVRFYCVISNANQIAITSCYFLLNQVRNTNNKM
jgi:hypothetical protein